MGLKYIRSSLDLNKEKSKMNVNMSTSVVTVTTPSPKFATDLSEPHTDNVAKSKSIMRVASKQDHFCTSKSKVALNMTPTVREEPSFKSVTKFLSSTRSTSRLVQCLK